MQFLAYTVFQMPNTLNEKSRMDLESKNCSGDKVATKLMVL